MAEDCSSIPADDGASTSPPPARRSGRNRRNRTPLVESFKEFVDNTPAEEVQDLSDQLHRALGSIANGPGSISGTSFAGGGGDGVIMSSCVARVQRSQSIDVPTAKISDSTTTTNGSNNNDRLATNPQRENRTSIGASMSIDVESSIMRRMSGEYYEPKSSSRRNSRAGSELAASMKLHAQQALAELGELSDDEDDQVILGVLEELKEEPGGSFRIVQEGDIER